MNYKMQIKIIIKIQVNYKIIIKMIDQIYINNKIKIKISTIKKISKYIKSIKITKTQKN